MSGATREEEVEEGPENGRTPASLQSCILHVGSIRVHLCSAGCKEEGKKVAKQQKHPLQVLYLSRRHWAQSNVSCCFRSRRLRKRDAKLEKRMGVSEGAQAGFRLIALCHCVRTLSNAQKEKAKTTKAKEKKEKKREKEPRQPRRSEKAALTNGRRFCVQP